jgi:peptide/nickel transport system substrate-binding protein
MAVLTALAVGLLCFSGLGATDNVAVINGYPVITADPATASDWYDTEAMYNLYSPLVYPAPEGGVRAHLATSWEPVGGDYTHWRFALQQGVKFHSGYELTAEDVAFSMTRFIGMGRGNSGPLGKVTAAVVDRYTVDFSSTSRAPSSRICWSCSSRWRRLSCSRTRRRGTTGSSATTARIG